MPEWKQLLGKQTWIGAAAGLLLSVTMDGIAAYLMVHGLMPEMAGWVYGSYALGALLATRMASKGRRGSAYYALSACVIMGGLALLLGIIFFREVSVKSHGIGVLIGLIGGGVCGGLIPEGKKKKGRAGKRRRSGAVPRK